MPRLAPRLVKALTSPNGHFLTRKGGKPRPAPPSEYSPPPPLSTTFRTRREHPIEPNAKRTRSILLDDVNPIVHPEAYKIRRQKEAVLAKDEELDPELKMLLHEEMLKQRANPYLRMMSGPLRQCVLTDNLYPSDFLLRLSTSQIPKANGKKTTYILPDGILHPKFRAKRVNRGHYIILWKDALAELTARGGQRRIHQAAEAHPMLIEQIQSQLEERIVQELEIAYRRYVSLPTAMRTSETMPPPVRRLEDNELENLWRGSGAKAPGEATGVAMIAFDALPSSIPSSTEPSPASPPREALGPFATLLPTHPEAHSSLSSSSSIPDVLPPHRIPLYHAHRLFTDLDRSKQARYWLDRFVSKSKPPPLPSLSPEGEVLEPSESDGEAEKRTVYLLSNPLSLMEHDVDLSGVVIALWRMRLWDGEGWESAVRAGSGGSGRG